MICTGWLSGGEARATTKFITRRDSTYCIKYQTIYSYYSTFVVGPILYYIDSTGMCTGRSDAIKFPHFAWFLNDFPPAAGAACTPLPS